MEGMCLVFPVVVESRCFKDLCIKISPEVSRFNFVMEEDKMCISGWSSSSKGFEWKNLKMEDRFYGKLAHELIGLPMEKSCIREPISASSTDNYLDESIIYTLDPWDKKDARPSYLSSKGERSSEVSETLTYRLRMNLYAAHEAKIHLFQGFMNWSNAIHE